MPNELFFRLLCDDRVSEDMLVGQRKSAVVRIVIPDLLIQDLHPDEEYRF